MRVCIGLTAGQQWAQYLICKFNESISKLKPLPYFVHTLTPKGPNALENVLDPEWPY